MWDWEGRSEAGAMFSLCSQVSAGHEASMPLGVCHCSSGSLDWDGTAAWHRATPTPGRPTDPWPGYNSAPLEGDQLLLQIPPSLKLQTWGS